MFRLMQAFIMLNLFVIVFNQTNSNKFGPYDLHWEMFKVCKGPKQGDCGDIIIEKTQNMSDVTFLLDVKRDCPVFKAKVTVGNRQNSNNSTTKLWNYSLDSPCEHFAIGPILIESYNITKNCKVNKGYYEVHLDMNARTSLFLGSSFFYGNYVFKVVVYTKNLNFFCIEAVMNIEKKISTK